jgi:hypothetical protein
LGLFSSIASFFGASAKKKAAGQAAAAQMAAAQQGIDRVTATDDATQANLAPYTQAGTKALGGISDLLGLNGDPAQGTSIEALQNSPLYQSLFRTGQNTVLANASATGGLRGGNIQHSLANFGSDTLAQVIQQQLSNLGGLSTQGANTAISGGQISSNAAQAIAELLAGKGAAQAGGILGKANATAAQYGAIGNGIGDLFGTFSPSGAGTSGSGGGIMQTIAKLF